MTLIDKKFRQLLIPNLLMVFAASISEFVDAFIVARLLGSTAMAIVNLASPVLFVMMTVSALLGVGGSTVYTSLIGNHKNDEASKAYTITVIVSLAIMTLIAAAMLGLFNPIVNTLCRSQEELRTMAVDYIYVLILSLPLLSVVTVIFMFLPSAGMPVFGAILILISNITNLCLDVVFIKYAGMGITGAAIATVCGYASGLLVFLLCRITGYCKMSPARVRRKDFRYLTQICSMGSSSALSQLSFCIKVYFCNALALKYGGTVGLVALSVCFQLISITSIFVGGIGSSLVRIVAYLRAQMDFFSLGRSVRKAYLLQLICSVVCAAFFFAFADTMAVLYNASDPSTLNVTVTAVRIFSLCLILRGLCINFMFYVQAIGKSVYASAISLIDGFVGIIPIALLLCSILGLDGLWWTFPACTLILLTGILVYNKITICRFPEKFRNLLLIEKDEEDVESWNCSFESRRYEEKSDYLRKYVSPQVLAVLDSFLQAMPHGGDKKMNDIFIRKGRNLTTVELRCEEDSHFDWKEPDVADIRIVRSIGMGMNTLQIKQGL